MRPSIGLPPAGVRLLPWCPDRLVPCEPQLLSGPRHGLGTSRPRTVSGSAPRGRRRITEHRVRVSSPAADTPLRIAGIAWQPSATLRGLLAPPRSMRCSPLRECDQGRALMRSCHSTRRCRHAVRHGPAPSNSGLSTDWPASIENRIILRGPHGKDRRHKGLAEQLPDPAIASCRALAASAIPPRAAEVMSGQQRSWPHRTHRLHGLRPRVCR